MSIPAGIATRAQLQAAELFGVPGFHTEVIQLLVPRGARPLTIPGVRVKVHELRRFPAVEELTSRDGLPITSLSRAAVDAAVWSRDVRRAWRVLVAPVQARRLRPAEIRAELERAGKCATDNRSACCWPTWKEARRH